MFHEVLSFCFPDHSQAEEFDNSFKDDDECSDGGKEGADDTVMRKTKIFRESASLLKLVIIIPP